MTKNILAGVNNVARKPNAIYVGVNNVARKVKEVYAGVGGVAQKVWPNNLIPDDSYQSLSYIGIDSGGSNGQAVFKFPANSTTYINHNTRIVYKFEMQSETFSYSANNVGGPYLFCVGRSAIYTDGQVLVLYNGRTSTAYYDQFYYRLEATGERFHFYYENANVGSSQDAARTNLYSTTEERYQANSLYTLDFNNNKKVYLYNNKGYYSVSSHNLVGTYNPFYSGFTFYNPDYYANSTYFHFTLTKGVNIFHSAQIYNGSTLQRDIVPCYRVSDRKVGLYDLVNRVAFIDQYSAFTVDYEHLIYSE